mmetsp:Transcript_10039/g.13420  ORF Transcript_10039/g.13420 Transcript_10039/m.13420 type:complete len:796 (-) Transcript_10039:753-3140(-)
MNWRMEGNIEEEERSDVLKLILYELSSAIASEPVRLNAIREALDEFNHDDEDKHNEELEHKADQVLFQKLAFAFAVDKTSEEVGLVATALEMVYRASRARVALSFSEMGEAILPLFVEMIRPPASLHIEKDVNIETMRNHREKVMDNSVEDQRSGEEKKADSVCESTKIPASPSDEETYVNPWPTAGKDDSSTQRVHPQHSPANPGGDDSDTLDTENDSSKVHDAAEEDDDEVRTYTDPWKTTPEVSHKATVSEDDTTDAEAEGDDDDDDEDRTYSNPWKGTKEDPERPADNSIQHQTETSNAGMGGTTIYTETIPEEDEKFLDDSAHGSKQTPTTWGNDSDEYDGNGNEHSNLDGDDDMEHSNRQDLPFGWEQHSKQPSHNVGLHRDYLQTNPLAVSRVLKILRYYSRVLSAMVPMAHQPGLLNALMYQMERRPISDDPSSRYNNSHNPQIPHGQIKPTHPDVAMSRIDAIATIVNLACAEENKITMVYHPGLLDAVVRAANYDPSEEAREHAAIVIMNLAYADENKVHMASQDGVLETLVKLLSDESPFTRRYASAALFTLACVFANTARMARHCDGQILEALRRVLLNDPIDEARINAAEALFNMARNNSEDTVETMGNHPRLLQSLAHAVITDYSADVRAYSARALEWLSADIHHPMRSHAILLSALSTASQWTKTTCIAQALKTQSTIAENRRPMAEHDEVLSALANLALLDGINDEEVRACAIIAIERLTTEPTTRHIMVKNEGIMTALTRATFSNNLRIDEDAVGMDDDYASTSILMKTALKNLAQEL